VGVPNIRVYEETTLAAANKLEADRQRIDEQVTAHDWLVTEHASLVCIFDLGSKLGAEYNGNLLHLGSPSHGSSAR
jgi:hypothetical protein